MTAGRSSVATIDEVLAREDGTQFAIALSDLVFPRWNRDGYESLTEAERVAYLVDALERDVNNGGFGQYFENCPGEAPLAAAALETIGAVRAAAIVRKAMASQGDLNPVSFEFQDYPDDITTLM